MTKRRTAEEAKGKLISFIQQVMPYDEAYSNQQLADGAGIKLQSASKYIEEIKPFFEGYILEFIPKGDSHVLVKRKGNTYLFAEIIELLKKMDKDSKRRA